MIGAFNYRGSGTGMGGRPDRSAQPAPGHDLEPVFVQVYVTDGPKQFLAHLAYCAFTNADTDQRANSMAMMDGPPPPPPAPRRNPVGGPPLTQPLAPFTQGKDLSFLTCAGGFGWVGKKNHGFNKWRFSKMVVWMVYFMENPIYKWMIWGYPHFRKPPHTHTYIYSTYRYYRRYSGIIGKPIFYLKRVWARGKSHFK